MKKIFLTCSVALLTIFATEAQTKKSSKKKKSTVSTEAKLNADIAKIKAEKKAAMELQRLDRMMIDSTRRADEVREEFVKDSMRLVWKETRLKEVDSINQMTWKQQMAEKDLWYATERSQVEINKAAKLNDIQGRQVKAVNVAYNNQAKAVRENLELTDADKATQYAALNAERRAKIKAIVGKSKESKLEKARVKYMAKHTDDIDSAWINQVAVVGKQ